MRNHVLRTRGLRTQPWARAAVAMFAVGWGANQFSSLLLAYRAQDGLSAAVTDTLFGFYAVGLIPTLLLVGPLSDRLGRRQMARIAVLTSVLATLVLILGDFSSWFLYPGRFLAGLASGAIFAPGTAWVKELSSPPYAPRGAADRGARRAAVALSAGFSLGPLIAGLISQWAPWPLVTPYLAHLLVVAVAGVLVWTAPETVARAKAQDTERDLHPGRGAGMRAATAPRFVRVVLPVAPWVFTAAAVSLTIGPALVTERTGSLQIAFAGLIAGLTLGTGVLVQPVARRLDARSDVQAMAAGLVAVIVGLLVETATALTGQPVLAVLAAVLLGAGYGFCLVAGLTETQRIADPHDLAALTAVYYALTYIGFGAPIVLTELARLADYPVIFPGVALVAAVTLVGALRGARSS